MEIEVVGSGAFGVDVVGESRYQGVLEGAVDDGAIVDVVLLLEDDNPYDDQAVAVTIGGQRCGYLSRADARRYRAALAAAEAPRANVRCRGKITGGFVTSDGGRAHHGLRLDLPDLAP